MLTSFQLMIQHAATRRHSLLAMLCVVMSASCAPAVQIETRLAASPVDSVSAQLAVGHERTLHGRVVQRHTISVLPFQVISADSAYAAMGYGFAELLLADLSVSHQLSVLERAHLEDIRTEVALSVSHQTDAATAVHAGRLLAARQLVVGSLAVPPNNSLTFSTAIADVPTGSIGESLAGLSSMDKLFAAERQLALRLFTELGIKLTKPELAKLDALQPPNLQAFLAFSKGARAEARGELADAAVHYHTATTLDPKFTLAHEHIQNLSKRSASSEINGRPTRSTDAASAESKSTADAAASKSEAKDAATTSSKESSTPAPKAKTVPVPTVAKPVKTKPPTL